MEYRQGLFGVAGSFILCFTSWLENRYFLALIAIGINYIRINA
jgi:hypothetical protein